MEPKYVNRIIDSKGKLHETEDSWKNAEAEYLHSECLEESRKLHELVFKNPGFWILAIRNIKLEVFEKKETEESVRNFYDEKLRLLSLINKNKINKELEAEEYKSLAHLTEYENPNRLYE